MKSEYLCVSFLLNNKNTHCDLASSNATRLDLWEEWSGKISHFLHIDYNIPSQLLCFPFLISSDLPWIFGSQRQYNRHQRCLWIWVEWPFYHGATGVSQYRMCSYMCVKVCFTAQDQFQDWKFLILLRHCQDCPFSNVVARFSDFLTFSSDYKSYLVSSNKFGDF